jgi:SSS family solute:Na+ symporter
LAGAKLASTVELDIQTALIVMGTIAVVYYNRRIESRHLHRTPYNGYIDWLVFIGIPIAYNAGYDVIKATLAPEYLSLTNVKWYQILNWSITIIPIWFVGMTLYKEFMLKGEEAKKRPG